MGVPLFQEQLLKIAMDIADFSGSEAEELRRAMGFKRPDRKMELITQKLREGMSKKGIPFDVQTQVVDYTKAFANYGFPESYAFSFALLAYASAYFMVYYRACLMAAMFNNSRFPLSNQTERNLLVSFAQQSAGAKRPLRRVHHQKTGRAGYAKLHIAAQRLDRRTSARSNAFAQKCERLVRH